MRAWRRAVRSLSREYDRFIDLGDIIAALRLKAERRIESAKAG
jgi:hypothetical protein